MFVNKMEGVARRIKAYTHRQWANQHFSAQKLHSDWIFASFWYLLLNSTFCWHSWNVSVNVDCHPFVKQSFNSWMSEWVSELNQRHPSRMLSSNSIRWCFCQLINYAIVQFTFHIGYAITVFKSTTKTIRVSDNMTSR